MRMIGLLGENVMLNWALKYRRLGLTVIPLKPNGKEPLIPWKEFQGRLATEEEINGWWNAAPNANIGIVTGKISGLAVIDLDGEEGLKSALKIGIESPVVSVTGNGKHLWYSLAPDAPLIENSVKKIAPGIDIRGEGGYVVAPPSISPNGRRYRFIGNINALNTLPDFPMNIIAIKPDGIPTNFQQKQESWIAKALEEMKDGNIDNTLVSILGRLRRDGWSAADSLILLKPHAARVGAEEGHLEAKIENIWSRYEAKRNELSLQSNFRQSGSSGSLVIHSPQNPDSIQQYEQYAVGSQDVSEQLCTGYPALDRYFKGGLKSSRLLVIAARTGTGKTNLILGIAKHLCTAGKRVLLFSTEMPYQEIWSRYIATLDSPEAFRGHQFYVCDSFSPNIEKVEEAINEIKPDVFIFDHINHVSEEQKELGTFMQGLNYLRRKYECAGIVTAQLNRSADWIDLKTGEKVTPRMSMIKGSGTIEQAASRVLLLSETRVLPEYTEIVGNLDKNDNGTKGLCFFGLFSKPNWRMEQLDKS